MARDKAVFGGEHSAHYYFRDFWYADTGMLAAMHVLAALGEQDDPLTELAARRSALRRLGRDQLHGRRRAVPRPPPSASWAAGSGRRVRRARRADRHPPGTATPMWWFNLRAATPSRCCGSTSRRPMRTPWRGCATMCSRSSEEKPDAERVRTRPGRRHRRADRAVAARDPALPAVPLRARRRHRSTAGPSCTAPRELRAGLPGRRRHPGAARRRSPLAGPLTAGGAAPMAPFLDESRIDDPDTMAARDSGETLRALATAGAQVREAITLVQPRPASTAWPAASGPGRCWSPRSAARPSSATSSACSAEPGLAGAGHRAPQPAAAGLGRARWTSSSPSRCPGAPRGRWRSPPRRPAAGRPC